MKIDGAIAANFVLGLETLSCGWTPTNEIVVIDTQGNERMRITWHGYHSEQERLAVAIAICRAMAEPFPVADVV